MTRPLGRIQQSCLRWMVRHSEGEWHRGCGWLWDTVTGTEKIMESLLRRGLVVKFKRDGFHNYGYAITDDGRKAVQR